MQGAAQIVKQNQNLKPQALKDEPGVSGVLTPRGTQMLTTKITQQRLQMVRIVFQLQVLMKLHRTVMTP
jgi:hypothetical protein